MKSNSAGVDLVVSAGDALNTWWSPRRVGFYDEEVSEHAVAMLLSLSRGLHQARDHQRMGDWSPRDLSKMHGSPSLFVENVRRFAEGEPLLNVVDREVGY